MEYDMLYLKSVKYIVATAVAFLFFLSGDSRGYSSKADSILGLPEALVAEHFFYRSIQGEKAPLLSSLPGDSPDLKHTIIEARLFPDSGSIQARAGLIIDYDSGRHNSLELRLRGEGMEVFAVMSSSGDSLEFQYKTESGMMSIQLPENDNGETDTLWVYYGGKLYYESEALIFGDTGIIHQVITSEYGYGISEGWYPSLLYEEAQKQIYDISLTVPQGYIACATGDSSNYKVNMDGSHTFSFSTKRYGPLAHSASFAFGRFKKYSSREPDAQIDVYTTSTNMERIKAIQYHAGVLMYLYRELFGHDYPWNTLALVENGDVSQHFGLSGFCWIILPKKFFLSTGDGLTIKEIELLAHEVAHQWWGRLVSSSFGESKWLAEAFAEFSAKYVVAQKRALAPEQNIRDPWFSSPFIASMRFGPENDKPLISRDAHYYVVYEKGAWVVRMLYNRLGAESFSKIAGKFLEDFKGRFVGWTEFAKFWSSQAPEMNLDVFFEQWLTRSGFPIYQVRGDPVVRNGDQEFDLRIDQLSDFDMPVDIVLYFPDNEMVEYSERIHLPTHVFSYTVQAVPDSFKLDPDDLILAQIEYPPSLKLSQHQNTIRNDEPYSISISIDSLTPMKKVEFLWKINNGDYNITTLESGTSWPDTVRIPAQHSSCTVSYYLSAEDNRSRSFVFPPGAPDSVLSFQYTAHDDIPDEAIWIGADRWGTPEEGELVFQDLILFDFVSERVLHTYPDAGGWRTALSANNRYLATEYPGREEMLVLNLETHEVVRRFYMANSMSVQDIEVTNDGKTLFLLIRVLDGHWDYMARKPVYMADLERGSLERIAELAWIIRYNPVTRRLYILFSEDKDAVYHKIFIYNTESRKIEGHFLLPPRAGFFFFNHLFNEIWDIDLNREINRYILKRRNLYSLAVLDSLAVKDESLVEGSFRLSPVFIPEVPAVAYMNCKSDPTEVHLIKFSHPPLHSTIFFESMIWEFNWWMCATPSGNYLVVKYCLNEGGYTKNMLKIINPVEMREIKTIELRDSRYFDFKSVAAYNHVPPEVLKGDLDGDGLVNVLDLIGMLKMISGAEVDIPNAADMDKNGKVNVFDLLGLLQLINDTSN